MVLVSISDAHLKPKLLCYWLIGYKSEVPTTPSLGSINLLVTHWTQKTGFLTRLLCFFFFNNRFFLIYIFTLFYFTILYWFCHTLTWIHHGRTWVPNHETPSHLPPHIISLDHPRAPAPSILYPAWNIDWWFVSCMIVYMFQCHSPKSSHPLPLPQSPKVCSAHLCLFCCLTYRVIITIFLKSIYMC